MCAFPTGWGRKCELVIQHSQVTADCTDFPVLVTKDTLPSEIFDADGSYPALNGGGDIRFSSNSDGSTQLACEIEQFVTDNNPANGKSAVWTKRTLSSAANTSIWIWYNKAGESQPAEGAAYGKHAVWNSDFKLVQHMNQDPSGSAPQMIDSTSNSNDGTSVGSMTSADLVDAKIGKGLDFDGNDDYLQVTDSASLKPLTQITVSCYIKFDVTGSSDKLFITKDDTGSNRQFTCGLEDTGTNWYFRLWDSSNGLHNSQYNTTPTVGTWYHFAVTYNGTSQKLYVDKVERDSDNWSANLKQGSVNLNIGSRAGSHDTDGEIDEVRISSIARASGWIETEYNNQSSPSTFIIEGTPEIPGWTGKIIGLTNPTEILGRATSGISEVNGL